MFLPSHQLQCSSLKLLTNEKRGGLKVVAFDKSPFKLFSLRFSTKYVQAPSYERPKTTQQTLILSFEIKNCFPIAVLRRSFMKKSEKLTCHVVNENTAIDSSPTLQISVETVCNLKRFMMVSRFLPLSQISGRMYNTALLGNNIVCK